MGYYNLNKIGIMVLLFFSRMISKQFHYQLRNSEKQAFVGPPDNMREHVLAAAKGKF